VLLDAPCSNLGTVRRRPEIKWRAAEASIPAHASNQQQILRGAAGAVRSGGVLLYSVCSLEPEEGPGVIESFLREHREFSPVALPDSAPRSLAGNPIAASELGQTFLLPHRHDVDGFFIARLRRR
jgi:16S rRNA (cytosine967-C5)-methyltransferase